MKKSNWNTYKITGFTHQVGTDPRATGGVHLHQVRKHKTGWQRRTVDSNGRYTSAGMVETLSPAEGNAKFASVK